MSLLREIQDAAINSSTELSVLLRKCKVLAARLGNPEFKQWVSSELDGYKDHKYLPDYRVLKVQSKGHFSGPFQSGLRNADIPLFCISKEYHEYFSHAYLMDSVAALESLASSANGGTLQEPWNPNLVALVGQDIYQNMNCMQAWKVIPKSAIVSALDAVRNRVLSFVLEIEAESPDAGEAPVNPNPVPQEKVHQIFNTYISGNVQNVAAGSNHVKQKAKSSDSDEVFLKLINAISKANQDKSVSNRLIGEVEGMKAAQGTASFKDHYQSFMSILADHIQVFGPGVAPFLPALTAIMP